MARAKGDKADEGQQVAERADGELPARQRKVLAALLQKGTVAGAAEVSGVGKATIWRWMSADAAFRKAYDEAHRQLLLDAKTLLAQRSASAVEVLGRIMEDDSAHTSARVSAAARILDQCVRMSELADLAERVAAIEAAQAAQAARKPGKGIGY